MVDINNILSVSLRIPLGIYDLAQVQSIKWAYRLGLHGEQYSTFARQTKNAEGKLVLADDAGVIGSPVCDSGRAAISRDTTRIVVVAYLPMETEISEAEAISASIQGALCNFLKATLAPGSHVVQ